MLGVQETKLKEIHQRLVFDIWGMGDGDFVHVDASGNSGGGGLLIVWNKIVFNCDYVIKEDNFLAVIRKWANIEGLVGCVNVHGPNELKGRQELFDKLDLLCNKEEIKWVVFGDFNEVRGKHERFNTTTNNKGVTMFNDFILRNGLKDVKMGGSKFTRVSDDGSKFSKLDRFLVTLEFEKLWRNIGVMDYGPPPFKFFNAWLSDKRLEEVVKVAWHLEVKSSRPDCIFRDKLKNVKRAIKEWRIGSEGDLELSLKKAKLEVKKWELLSETSSPREEDRLCWLEARKKWLNLEEKSVSMAKQKAKIKWIKEGDENSKFFHIVSKFRERRNSLLGLNIGGTWMEDPKEAVVLEVRFSEEEVWLAVKDCGPNKSPGPDGFTIEFIKKFWNIIKTDLLKVFDWFWKKETLAGGCNASFVSLIPKLGNPLGLNDFRPISLIGILYKLISKVLAERLKKVISKVISLEQSAFLKGRSILDGVLIANEVVEYLKKAKRKGAILKIDFEKAYDSVGWSFLLDALEHMGFGTKWRKWIKSCLHSSSISVLVNGSPTEEFTLESGLRQGDPLAPFLFLVIAECFHLMVVKAENSGLLKGVKVGSNNIPISHLQYSDDVILFGPWETENLKNMMKLMECFYAVSGLKMNLNKTKLYGIGIKEEEVKEWAGSLGCGFGKLPLMYLGIPVGTSMHYCANWLPVIEKVKKKLAGWRAKVFSFGGRWTLTKSVLGSLSLYYFSLFRAPVLESFENGGLNVGSLKDFNWGLLCKWWWRFHSESESLWVRVIKSIFGEDGGLASLDRWKGIGNSSVWGNIVKVGLEVDKLGINFSSSFWKSIGDGTESKFWEDYWLKLGSLKDNFPRLFKLEEDRKVSVAERGSFSKGTWSWEWGWRREPRGRELGELERLKIALKDFVPNKNVSDKVFWKLDPGGEFSVKELRKMIEKAARRHGSASLRQTLWLKEIPKKVCIFMWRVGLGKLPVRVEIDRRGIDLDSILCPKCQREGETVEHALFGCEDVKDLWIRIGDWWNLDMKDCNSLDDLINLGNQDRVGVRGGRRWFALIWCVSYLIWANRNNLIFRISKVLLKDEFFNMQLKTFEWINRRSKEIAVDWKSWHSDPQGGSL
ncbi:hypothetical protein OSB04_000300 [Centaurea solstitialis]|uniref:Reverse transcriptase domain-containing protein n=1 Tax=Centaurea solstitialis TaxID=347529 RepID=A0AA38WTS2_9ASTR|nr:hypothetical protein OSB04_000300 [Centaurea solstitialis]